MSGKRTVTPAKPPTPDETSRRSFLLGALTGVICALLWAATGAVAWVLPEKAPAIAASASTVLITLTVIKIVINQTDRTT